MTSAQINGEVSGNPVSWRSRFPELAEKVCRVTAPSGRGIAWEGESIWAYKDRPTNLASLLMDNVRLRPQNEAYVFHPSGVRLTWSQAGLKAGKVASRLQTVYGLKKGDRLGLMIPGTEQYVLTYLACLMTGVIVVPVNMGIASKGVAHQINKVRLSALVTDVVTYREKIKPIERELTSDPFIFMVDALPEDSKRRTILFSDLEEGDSTLVRAATVDEWDPCAISFTSGTTGVPKGTVTMHTNAIGCALTALEVLKGLNDSDVNICLPPLYHNTAVYTDFLPALLTGGKMVVTEAFNPEIALELIEREKVTWCVAAPIMLWMMMHSDQFKETNCSSLRKFAFGGHAASATFIRELYDAFNPIAIVNAGSVSESTAMGFALPTEDAMNKIASCGLATLNSEIALFDDDGKEIREPNVIGEVAYKGQQTNARYWDEPQKTKETFRSDGYVLSGDWAKFDAEGYLWLLDRKKDMIVRGGQNVYCIEIENELYLNDGVLRVAIVGVPDHVFSERIKAVIVRKPGANLSADDIRHFCEGRLAHYECPEYVVFADRIPTNPAGKTMKRELRDFWGNLDLGEQKYGVNERFDLYMNALPDGLKDRGMLRYQGELLTPRETRDAIANRTNIGLGIMKMIEDDGIIALLQPDESRFRA